MNPKDLVSDRQRPAGWLNSDEGREWFARRSDLFKVMAANHAKSQQKPEK